MEPNVVVEMVERLGGWGVVVWIVFWITRKAETNIKDFTTALKDQGEAIRAISDDLKDHFRLEAADFKRVIDSNERLIKEFHRLTEKIITKLDGQ